MHYHLPPSPLSPPLLSSLLVFLLLNLSLSTHPPLRSICSPPRHRLPPLIFVPSTSDGNQHLRPATVTSNPPYNFYLLSSHTRRHTSTDAYSTARSPDTAPGSPVRVVIDTAPFDPFPLPRPNSLISTPPQESVLVVGAQNLENHDSDHPHARVRTPACHTRDQHAQCFPLLHLLLLVLVGLEHFCIRQPSAVNPVASSSHHPPSLLQAQAHRLRCPHKECSKASRYVIAER